MTQLIKSFIFLHILPWNDYSTRWKFNHFLANLHIIVEANHIRFVVPEDTCAIRCWNYMSEISFWIEIYLSISTLPQFCDRPTHAPSSHIIFHVVRSPAAPTIQLNVISVPDSNPSSNSPMVSPFLWAKIQAKIRFTLLLLNL